MCKVMVVSVCAMSCILTSMGLGQECVHHLERTLSTFWSWLLLMGSGSIQLAAGVQGPVGFTLAGDIWSVQP